jgi:signal transduction histidine kinase/ligand-binding sensor domain-containing protein/DNA-binding response OmpR family regulator
MTKELKLFLILFFLACNFVAKGQLHHFEKIPTQEGDVNLSVRHVLQDNNGFLWLATFSGLYRFTGDDYIREQHFPNNTQINADINALLQDDAGNLWIGTNDGLAKFNPVTEELIIYRTEEDQANSISSNKIRSLAKDKLGRIWIGTMENGLNLYNPQEDNFIQINFNDETETPPVYIKCILPAKDGKIWLGTLGQGLFCFHYTSSEISSFCQYRNEDESNSISHNFIYKIFIDTDETIAVATRNGLDVFNNDLKKFENYSSNAFLPGSLSNLFRSVFRDRNGRLWLGTWGGLILCNSFSDLKTGNFQVLKHNRNVANSISHNQIMDVFQDKSGVIWVCTENGLNRYDPYLNQFIPLQGDLIDELSEQTATSFFPYKKSMLILTLSDGLLQKNANELHSFYQKDIPEVKNERFYSLFVDSDNNVWAGSYKGLLVKLDAKTKAISTFQHSEENIPIYSICEVEKNLLAIGTFGEGLKYLDTKSGKFWAKSELPGNIQINNIYIDTKQRMWVTSETGILKKNKGSASFEQFLPDNPDSLLNPNIFLDIAESKNGEIFVGGRNGIYIYDESTKRFTRKRLNTTTQLWVTNLQFDSEQNLWMNLNFNKIAKWNTQTNKIQTFNVNNGIRSSSYNRRGFYIDENDRIYLSGFDQIYEFDIHKSIINEYSPTPKFSSLVINNTEIHSGSSLNKQKILDKNITFSKSIVLENQNKDFTISFTSTSYLNTKANKYRYILHGYEQNWHIGNNRSANYTNIRPGKYTFEVFSANNDGLWSKDSAQLQIQIKPIPLLSYWAITLYTLVSILFVYFLRRIILIRLKLRRELLIEKVKRDKEEKFHQERLRFYTNISHELRTPLTLIMGPTKELISTDKSNSANAKLHQLILNNSQRLLSLVNQLLDFRKSLHQGMQLKVTPANLIEIVESNIEAFAYVAKEKHIQTDFKTSERKLSGWFDVEKIDIILFNILSNAYKYTPEYGFISLELNTSNANKNLSCQHIELKISNTGKGIPKHLHEKVFERFYQISDSKNTTNVNTGTGIGLALVKNMIELHHGKIKLESVPGKSTTFTILLPKNREEYSDEEIFDFTRDADRRTKELIKTVDVHNEESVFEKQNSQQARILIVEDNQELRDYLAGFLSKEYKVYTATDGLEGLERCKAKNPDLIISDVMMDNMDGLQFCKTVKSTPEISHIPVILMTALASVENKMEGYKTGADDYITKPFEPELLKIRIHNVLENLGKLKAEFGKNETVNLKELTISKIDEEFMNTVLDLLNQNLDNADFDIDCFSKSLGVSSSQLYRKMKGVAGVSPNEFIRTYRLRKAAKMITETNLSISEIAYNVGFNDSLYFSKCFKKQFGTSPSKYST